MSLVHEIDYGTPESKSEKTVTLTIDGQQIAVPEGTSIMRAAMEMGTQDSQAVRHRHGRCFRLLPALPGRDRGPRRNAGLLHDAGRRRHGGEDADRAAQDHPQGRDGALHLRPSARLPDLLGERRLRTAGHGGRGRPARRALRLSGREPRLRQDRRRGQPNWLPKDESNPYFTYDPSKCIVCSRCVRACEEVQGTFALTIAGRGFDSRVSPGMEELS